MRRLVYLRRTHRRHHVFDPQCLQNILSYLPKKQRGIEQSKLLKNDWNKTGKQTFVVTWLLKDCMLKFTCYLLRSGNMSTSDPNKAAKVGVGFNKNPVTEI